MATPSMNRTGNHNQTSCHMPAIAISTASASALSNTSRTSPMALANLGIHGADTSSPSGVIAALRPISDELMPCFSKRIENSG